MKRYPINSVAKKLSWPSQNNYTPTCTSFWENKADYIIFEGTTGWRIIEWGPKAYFLVIDTL